LLHDIKRQHAQGGLQGQRQMKLKAIGANFGVGESGVCQADHRVAVLDRATDLLQLCSNNVLTPMERVRAMIKTLTKHGNSLALVIEKPALELIGADADTQFDISTDGQVLILAPVKDPARSSAFRAALDKVNARYPKALKKLAG